MLKSCNKNHTHIEKKIQQKELFHFNKTIEHIHIYDKISSSNANLTSFLDGDAHFLFTNDCSFSKRIQR